jgi:Family of unknown function (DUF6790)
LVGKGRFVICNLRLSDDQTMWIAAFHIFIFLAPFLIVWSIHTTRDKPLRKEELKYYLLLFFLMFCVGIQGIVTGVLQMFGAEGHCTYSGRPWSPFVWELGMMNISYGVLGVLCYWLRGSFWAATGIGYSIFLLLAFCGHIYEVISKQNYNIGSIGPQVWVDLSIALVLLVLIFRSKK